MGNESRHLGARVEQSVSHQGSSGVSAGAQGRGGEGGSAIAVTAGQQHPDGARGDRRGSGVDAVVDGLAHQAGRFQDVSATQGAGEGDHDIGIALDKWAWTAVGIAGFDVERRQPRRAPAEVQASHRAQALNGDVDGRAGQGGGGIAFGEGPRPRAQTLGQGARHDDAIGQGHDGWALALDGHSLALEG
jgi:hypothetical protein